MVRRGRVVHRSGCTTSGATHNNALSRPRGNHVGRLPCRRGSYNRDANQSIDIKSIVINRTRLHW